MILTISTTHVPATDLGFLLHKNPARAQAFEMSFGKAHVFYPESSAGRCTAALLLDVDPVALVRKGGGRADVFTLDQYVNDRVYVASSFLSVAIAQVYGSALAGRSKERAELAEVPISLVARLSAVPCRGGEELIRRLFEPLGYAVSLTRHPLDEEFPEWGEGWRYTLEVSAPKRGHWRSESSRWGWKRSSALRGASRSGGCTSVCSACWRWRVSRWTRGCERGR
jgi:3' terminal RNA ribose 2'-O-methyltransferase Hen1